MAGLLVEKVSGVEYEKYMVENILKPLGVKTEHPFVPHPKWSSRWRCPTTRAGRRQAADAGGAGALRCLSGGRPLAHRRRDGAVPGRALNGGGFQGKRIASEASIKLTHEAQFGGTYAFGWSVKKDEENGHTIINHTGGSRA